MKNLVLILIVLFPGVTRFVPQASAQVSENDSLAIIEASLDYVDGWYKGDAERMKRGLHPDLVKRSVITHPKTERSIMRHISASTLVEYTRAGGGQDSLEEHEKNGTELVILDVFKNIATVKAVSVDYVDYLHLVKYDGKWVIINILWDRLRIPKK